MEVKGEYQVNISQRLPALETFGDREDINGFLLSFSFFYGWTTCRGLKPRHFRRLHDHAQTHHTRWDSLPDNTQNSQEISIPPAGFEPSVPARERPQTHGLNRKSLGSATTGRVLVKMFVLEKMTISNVRRV